MVFVKYLLKKKNYFAGRNNTGRITCRHRCAMRAKRFFFVNTRRRISNEIGEVIRLVKDPVRTGFLALVYYWRCGLFEYILAPHQVKRGCKLVNVTTETALIFEKFPTYLFNLGNSFFLQSYKVGSRIFNIEKHPGSGGLFVRAAGCVSKIIQKIMIKRGQQLRVFVAVRFKSGRLYYFRGECRAVLGQVSNNTYRKQPWLYAGKSRRKGIRSHVRGVAMNPIDHPHGGGEGKTSGGRSSVSAWGKLTKGKKTISLKNRRKLKKYLGRMRSGRMIK